MTVPGAEDVVEPEAEQEEEDRRGDELHRLGERVAEAVVERLVIGERTAFPGLPESALTHAVSSWFFHRKTLLIPLRPPGLEGACETIRNLFQTIRPVKLTAG